MQVEVLIFKLVDFRDYQRFGVYLRFLGGYLGLSINISDRYAVVIYVSKIWIALPLSPFEHSVSSNPSNLIPPTSLTLFSLMATLSAPSSSSAVALLKATKPSMGRYWKRKEQGRKRNKEKKNEWMVGKEERKETKR